MKRALVNPERCQNCPDCAVEQICPMQAVFRETPADRPWIDFYRCSGCLRCLVACRHGAVEALRQPCNARHRRSW